MLQAGGRFDITRKIGAGGMGVVYEAFDREREIRVALKTLRHLDPGSLYRFKQEFRALADVTHRNLVSLYELIEYQGRWFFTMELVEGIDFLSFARGASLAERTRAAAAPETVTAALWSPEASQGADQTSPTRVTSPSSESLPARVAAPARPARLWAALPQLAQALIALHGSGHLHRDVKPNNILVTDEGRVVVLDFGVITQLARGPNPTSGGGFVGTPRYAAPEQAAASALPTPASDWYSVGVILYEALTGRRPYTGSPQEVLEARQRVAPEPPARVYPEVDPDLAALCMRLLDRDPTARPTGDEVLRLLGDAQQSQRRVRRSQPGVSVDDSLLIGREAQLEQLRAAFDAALAGTGCSMLVRGRSGIGKTALVQHFLATVAHRADALILAGRCYERESVPYQAIDTLVDSLCQYLLQLPRAEADALMPLDVRSLARAFPVLSRVEAVSEAPRRSSAFASDPQELRRRAFAALLELISRIAEQRPLVLFIDDLQWGDADSVPFVVSLMRPPAPPLLFLASYRSEEAESSPFLRALRDEANAAADEQPLYREISVDRLPLAAARELAAALLDEAAGVPAPAEHVARESGGSPFFIQELVRYVAASPDGAELPRLDLRQVITSRMQALSEAAARLLELIAVAGKPVLQNVVRHAADLGTDNPRALGELRTANMVRTTGARAFDTVETYHDRIRETVVAGLSDSELRELHRQLARGVAATDRADAESLAAHYAAAGERATALDYAKLAANAASDALAFERAAAMYGLALELTPDADHDERGRLGRMLGDSLVHAGRGVDAARAYLAAAALSGPKDALDLKVRAGSEFLRAGRVDEGMEVLVPALALTGVVLPHSPARLLLSLMARRALLRLRGTRFKDTSIEEVAPQTLTRIDAMGAASGVLGMADHLRGAYVQTRHLFAALRAGDPLRVGRALTYEAAYASVGGPGSLRRTRRVLAALQAIAERTGEPLLVGLHNAMSSLAAYQCGDWRSCRTFARNGEAILREKCQGVAWELTNVQLYQVWSLFWMGAFEDLATRTERFVREARERGDLYAEVSLSTGLPGLPLLARDDPEGARRRMESAFSKWTRAGFHLQHYWIHLGLVQCELYAGDATAALERIESKWKTLKRQFMLRIVAVRSEMLHLRARAALTAAQGSEDASHYLRVAARATRRFERLGLDWSRPGAQLLRAGIEASRDRHQQAAQHLRDAEEGFRAADMAAFAASAHFWLGALLGGSTGSQMVAESSEELRRLGVRNPARMSAFLAPGFPVPGK